MNEAFISSSTVLSCPRSDSKRGDAILATEDHRPFIATPRDHNKIKW
jgi:hypothetical protein